ncbi:MAG: hypothetical protein IJG13_20205 [Kiritimatiellae bacterium]|nr:hypothetical protein [Kiritimatiellia bacterium]
MSKANKTTAVEFTAEARRHNPTVTALFSAIDDPEETNAMLDIARYIIRKHAKWPRRYWKSWENMALQDIKNTIGHEIVWNAGNLGGVVAGKCDRDKLLAAIRG